MLAIGNPTAATFPTMTSLHGGVAAQPASPSAQSTLTGLMTLVGHTGLPASAGHAGLLAMVDQHAAAVRDSLDGDRRPLTAAALAGYARGVRDAAQHHGWSPPPAPVDWRSADWVLTRLLAVCQLARQLPTTD